MGRKKVGSGNEERIFCDFSHLLSVEQQNSVERVEWRKNFSEANKKFHNIYIKPGEMLFAVQFEFIFAPPPFGAPTK